jgi:environmental stress-induced protein Ves
MPRIELLSPASYRRIPWKNGRGELVVIDRAGADSWENMGVAWHFGRTTIIEEGPFSDYTGYERFQVMIRGSGLVLVASDREIDLRRAWHPQRYDGGLPVRTRLEQGPVEVVNLIANRALFDIDMRTGENGAVMICKPGQHVVYAPARLAHVEISGHVHALPQDHALRVIAESEIDVEVRDGPIVIGSILGKH